MKNVKLVATDLDGTFLRNDSTISSGNLKALHELGEDGILRVAATGRNLHKVNQVLNEHIPFDFVVFSSGAGVMNWKSKKLIYHQNLKESSSTKLLEYFVLEDLNFHAFYPVPDNHMHYYYRGKEPCEEFDRYFHFNKAYANEISKIDLPVTELCQFLVILKENEDRFEKLKNDIEKLCPEIRVIRASSPITDGYIWLEIFHKSVSKGNGVNEICKLEKINKKYTLGLGNDYNDFDLLEFVEHSFLTENSPKKIRHKYPLMPSNEEDAFATLVKKIHD